jgi:hypothetical protein
VTSGGVTPQGKPSSSYMRFTRWHIPLKW